jgi:hypothetical protein
VFQRLVVIVLTPVKAMTETFRQPSSKASNMDRSAAFAATAHQLRELPSTSPYPLASGKGAQQCPALAQLWFSLVRLIWIKWSNTHIIYRTVGRTIRRRKDGTENLLELVLWAPLFLKAPSFATVSEPSKGALQSGA